MHASSQASRIQDDAIADYPVTLTWKKRVYIYYEDLTNCHYLFRQKYKKKNVILVNCDHIKQLTATTQIGLIYHYLH